MIADDTPRERLARLETKFEHMDRNLLEIKGKVDSIHDTITQARGAKIALIGLGGVVSSIVTILATKLMPIFK